MSFAAQELCFSNVSYHFTNTPRIIYRKGEQKVMFFYSGRIRTLVAMATYSSHRLIMGKIEICDFFLSQWRYLDFLQKCLLSSPLCFI